LRVLRAVEHEQRPATPDEQQVLGRWSSWGAVAQATFARPEYAWARDELAELLSTTEYAAAQRATVNAHYTDAALVQQIWHAVDQLGFTGGQVLEPGCGSGHFIAFAPDGAHVTGVEMEPASAAIARLLHPHAQILVESFADTRAPEATFDLTIGNVPFGDLALLSRSGARFRCCHRPVSPDRSPNPPCRLLGNGLSTVPAVRRGSWLAKGLGSVTPVGVAGDRHALDPEVLDPVRRDPPPPVRAAQVTAKLTPVPAVACPQHVSQPPPGEGVQLAERPLCHGEFAPLQQRHFRVE
jgi:SAM-dependent methyltransferase